MSEQKSNCIRADSWFTRSRLRIDVATMSQLCSGALYNISAATAVHDRKSEGPLLHVTIVSSLVLPPFTHCCLLPQSRCFDNCRCVWLLLLGCVLGVAMWVRWLVGLWWVVGHALGVDAYY